MAAVAPAKERQMAQMVADVLVGVLEQIGVRQIFGLIGDSSTRWATRFAAA